MHSFAPHTANASKEEGYIKIKYALVLKQVGLFKIDTEMDVTWNTVK